MRVSDIQSLFDYNAWANQRLLTAAADLSADELTATTRFPRTSIRGSFVHIQSAVRFHLSQWEERSLRPRLDEDQFPDVAAIAAQFERDEEELRAFLASLTDDDLDQPRTIRFQDVGVSVTAPMWQLMVHIVNHGTQHRSDIAQMLTDIGRSPGDLDLMDMLPESPIVDHNLSPKA